MAKNLSKAKIDQYRQTMMAEEKNLKSKIEHLKESDPFNDPEHANDNAAVDTDIREQMDHETIQAQVGAMKKRLSRMESAYLKMEKGTYGLCESCGKEIPEPRLELVPEAQYCVECEKRLVK
jgi:RNA polymerase-binding transcription factor DksA